MRHARPGRFELVTLEDSALSFFEIEKSSDAQTAKPRTVLVLVLVVNQLDSRSMKKVLFVD